MTSEQNEKWQKSINVLDYLDHHALNLEVLAATQKRIKGRRGAPGWALELRRRCIAQGWTKWENWVPEFALRSEVAMVGLTLLHPKPEERVSLYRCLLGDFINRALVPFADNLEPIGRLRDLCLACNTTQEQWNNQQRQIQQWRLVSSSRIRTMPEDRTALYEDHRLQFAALCVEIARFIQLYGPEEWWLTGGTNLVSGIFFLHRRRIELFPEAADEGAYRPVADAFLAALEAECPPPNWLYGSKTP